MSIVHKFLAADSTALADKRQVLTVCSTGGVDRQGDIVVQSGIDTKSFMRAGGTVLWGHDPDKPIAKALSIGVEGGSLRALVQFPPEGVSAKSDETYGLIKAGIVNATSIGFAPVSSEPMEPPWNGLKYLAVELMEFSFVSVPAMPEATVIARSYRGREKSADLSHVDNEADRLAMLMGCLVDGTREGKKAIASHEETLRHLGEMDGWMHHGIQHAKALLRAGFLGPDHPSSGDGDGGDDDDADVELAARVGRRRANLDALDRADVGRVAARRPAPARELGGAFLVAELRRGEQALIDRIYGA